MKDLYLVRHAEASKQGANGRDFDRPLSTQGEKDSMLLGSRLTHYLKPEIVCSSPALRAKRTGKILAMAIDYPTSSILFDDRIYEADLEDLLAVLRDVDNSISCAMLVGHNPALTQLVNALGQSQTGNMPTCSVAVLRISSDSWEDLDRVSTELMGFHYPGKEGE